MTYDDAKDWIFENLEDYVPSEPKIGSFEKWVFPVISRENINLPDLREILAAPG